jgi:uncharacterized membrane protein YczE
MGMSPWGVFHIGLEFITRIPFGYITQIVGAIILLLSILLLKTEVGVGTILNVLLVGPWIVFLDSLYDVTPQNKVVGMLIFMCGFVFMTLGRSLYISSKLGQGPRDGFFVGLSKKTNWPVKYVKLVIEFIVFVIGTILLLKFPAYIKNYIGIGTIITVLFSGYMVQYFFSLFKFTPSMSKGYSFLRYFKSTN